MQKTSIYIIKTTLLYLQTKQTYILYFSQSEKRIAHGNHVLCSIGMKSYRGMFIDTSYKILVYLAKWFQSRRFLEIVQPETRITYMYGRHFY